jgi:hypothetical protein
MLVLEDSDEDRLYFGKGLPREWGISGKEIGIERAPTRWGRVNMKIAANPNTGTIRAKIDLERAGSPKEIQVKLRLPRRNSLRRAMVNGRPAVIGGRHNDCVIIPTATEKHFQVVAEFS